MKIRPTRGLIWYVLILLLSLLPAALTNGPVGYVPCLTVVLCALLSLGQLLAVKNRLRCETKPSQTVLTRGQEIPFAAEVENASRLPAPNVQVEFYLTDGSGEDVHVYPLHLGLSPGERRTFSVTASFAHIGAYEAGLRQLVVTDLFGIFRAVGPQNTSARLDIQPRLLAADRLPVSQYQTAENDRARTASPLSGMDYVGVREYAYGDPIKTIQWKLSAHAASLMTKQMESYTNSGVAIVLDFCVPDYDRETRLDMADAIAEAGAAAGSWTARNGMDYVLILPGDDGLPQQCTPSSFQDLRAWLPYMQLRPVDETGRLGQMLRRECGSSHSQSNLLLCAADLSEDTTAALEELKQNGKSPALYLLVPEGLEEKRARVLRDRMTRLQVAGIPCQTGKNAVEVLE